MSPAEKSTITKYKGQEKQIYECANVHVSGFQKKKKKAGQNIAHSHTHTEQQTRRAGGGGGDRCTRARARARARAPARKRGRARGGGGGGGGGGRAPTAPPPLWGPNPRALAPAGVSSYAGTKREIRASGLGQ